MNTALKFNRLLNRRTALGVLVETRSFSVVEHVWFGCQTERLKLKFDFGLEGVESGYCAVARHTCVSYGFKD